MTLHDSSVTTKNVCILLMQTRWKRSKERGRRLMRLGRGLCVSVCVLELWGARLLIVILHIHTLPVTPLELHRVWRESRVGCRQGINIRPNGSHINRQLVNKPERQALLSVSYAKAADTLRHHMSSARDGLGPANPREPWDCSLPVVSDLLQTSFKRHFASSSN